MLPFTLERRLQVTQGEEVIDRQRNTPSPPLPWGAGCWMLAAHRLHHRKPQDDENFREMGHVFAVPQSFLANIVRGSLRTLSAARTHKIQHLVPGSVLLVRARKGCWSYRYKLVLLSLVVEASIMRTLQSDFPGAIIPLIHSYWSRGCALHLFASLFAVLVRHRIFKVPFPSSLRVG
jgi:hypothetical protein